MQVYHLKTYFAAISILYIHVDTKNTQETNLLPIHRS